MAQRVQAVTQGASDHAIGGSAPYGVHDSLEAGRKLLAGNDLRRWLALRRVNEGGVTLSGGFYYHHGRAVPHYLDAPLTSLVETGRLALGEAGLDAGGMQQVGFTERGRELYAVLCGKRGVCTSAPSRVRVEWAAQE